MRRTLAMLIFLFVGEKQHHPVHPLDVCCREFDVKAVEM